MEKKTRMNFSSFIIVFFTSLVVFSQEIKEGTYCVESGNLNLNYNCYTFYKNGTFDYKSGMGDEENTIGKGIYQVKDSELIVEFKKIAPKKLGYSKIQFWKQKGDSVSVEVQVRNIDNSFVKEGHLMSSIDSSKVISIIEGKAIFKIKNSIKESIIKIGLKGYDSQEINIKNYYNYKVEVFLNKKSGVPFFDRKINYPLEEVKDSYYITMSSNGYKVLWEKMH